MVQKAVRVIRPMLILLALYFLFLAMWRMAYLHKVRQWPAYRGVLVQRQLKYFRRQTQNYRYQTGAYGLTFVEETIDVPTERIRVVARDFGSLSPRKAQQYLKERSRQYPPGSVLWVHVNPRYAGDASTLDERNFAPHSGAQDYLLYMGGCIVLYGLLCTLP